MARYVDVDGLGVGRKNRDVFNVPELADGWNSLFDLLEEAPTADVVEVKYGRWKGAGLGDYLCSECWEVYSGGNEFNYCPNCGAKMDGGKVE
jgi:hypothetical protein